jgi:hypothetical protein
MGNAFLGFMLFGGIILIILWLITVIMDKIDDL